jgi:hypothetical protein
LKTHFNPARGLRLTLKLARIGPNDGVGRSYPACLQRMLRLDSESSNLFSNGDIQAERSGFLSWRAVQNMACHDVGLHWLTGHGIYAQEQLEVV